MAAAPAPTVSITSKVGCKFVNCDAWACDASALPAGKHPSGTYVSVRLHSNPLAVAKEDAISLGVQSAIACWEPRENCLHTSGPANSFHLWSAARLACVVSAWFGDCLFFHSAGLAIDSLNGFLCLAPSGGGKSTLTDLAEGYLGLGDESTLVDVPMRLIHGTPFRSSAKKIPSLIEARLKAILLLEKSPDPECISASGSDALPRVIAQVYRPPRSVASHGALLTRVRQLVESVPSLRFRFPKDSRARDLLNSLIE